MEIYVDDQAFQSSGPGSQTLAQLVDEVKRQIGDRMIVSIRCDGSDITDDGFGESMARSVDSCQRVELYTGAARELVEDAMDQAAEMLDATEQDRLQAVELLGAGQTADGIRFLGNCMRNWYQVHQSIANSLAMLDIDPDTVTVEGRKMAEALETSRARLEQIKQALESLDYVLLSDTLQYEFEEVVRIWKAIVAAIRGKL